VKGIILNIIIIDTYMAKIIVKGTEVTIISVDEKDYISLTDMVRGIENGLALIEKWLRNKNTIEFLGIWEEMYNPGFNSPEFEGIKNEDFICITDMIKAKDGSFFVADWLRNRNTLEYPGICEQVYNPNFI
jgi:hypothetical protein